MKSPSPPAASGDDAPLIPGSTAANTSPPGAPGSAPGSEEPALDEPGSAPATELDPAQATLEQEFTPKGAEFLGEEVSDNERHLPIEIDVLRAALEECVPPPERADFRRLADALVARWHAELALELNQLRMSYRPFDPTRDTRPVPGEPKGEEARTDFTNALSELAKRANYVELGRTEIERSIESVSPEGLDVAVDLDAFAELRIFARGRFTRRFQVRKLLGKREILTQGYHRFLLAVSMHDHPDRVYLRLYRDVMDKDLEMFLPNTKVRIGRNDKIKLGILGGGGTLGGVVATATKVGATTTPQGWALALAGLGGVLWRQVSQVFHQRTKYMARLSNALYFHGLDNDYGALVHVAQMAAQQECKEVLLGYTMLLAPSSPIESVRDLDDQAEQFLRNKFDLDANFDVADALRKLDTHGILCPSPTARLRVLAPHQALAHLR